MGYIAHGGCISSYRRETTTMVGRVRESGDCAGCDRLGGERWVGADGGGYEGR